ncbi:MAG: alpha/beta hydrolase [Isosphaera sp.]|nr:alpha/beta hydrolase [Isosphaera sp.]
MLAALALALAAPPAGAPAPRLVGESVELRTDTGTLRGVIDLPPGPGPWPAVILHAGSGPTDRDGNGPLTRTDNLKMLGRALAAEGIAVLRYDKRGVAGSLFALAREEDARLDTYADDVRAWAALLRKDGRFTKLGYVGHSEGALVGLIAAADAKFDAFVSLCGPGRPLQDVLREQLKGKLPEKLAAAADAILTELSAGRAVAEVPKELQVLFRPSVQPFLISAFKRDPAKLIAGVPCPVLVVSGSTDLQVTAEDAKRLGDANPKARVVTVKGMNHVLKAVGGDLAKQLPSYADPSLPLHPRVGYEVGAFLKPVLAGK